MSPYFKSPVFTKVLERITKNENIFTLKQSEGKLKIVARGVDTMQKAYGILSKLQ
jgi:arginine repressor